MLTFNAPLSTERADRLARELAARRPATVVDLGCGWGEFLLRVLAVAREATGTGVDTHAADLARAGEAASVRHLGDRVAFVEGSAADYGHEADVLISVGAYQAFGTIPEALTALRGRLRPGGRLLFGAEYWQRPPTDGELAHMWAGISADDCTALPGLVDMATAAGFRPLRIETATRGEWEEFESAYGAELEAWLLDHPDHPDADEVRTKVDKHRDIWLRGHRDVMGFAYLTLGVPSPGGRGVVQVDDTDRP
jgi:SAM-dependent methyltransferase